MQTGAVDGVAGDVTELLLAVEGGDLILAEESPPLVFVTVLNAVEPFDEVGFGCCGLGCRLSVGYGCRDGREDEGGEEAREEWTHDIGSV